MFSASRYKSKKIHQSDKNNHGGYAFCHFTVHFINKNCWKGLDSRGLMSSPVAQSQQPRPQNRIVPDS